MSTAGKVLVVLIMLTTLVWITLSAGVSQLNTNGNKRLHDLAEQVAKLQDDVKQAQDDIVATRDQSSSVQEELHRQLTVLRSRQSDIEKARSQIRESLSRNEYQLELVTQTIDRAKAALQHRVEDQQTDEQTLAKSRAEVKELIAKSNELVQQLGALRKEFQTKYHSRATGLGSWRIATRAWAKPFG
jgi:peptidoglycan hydrolase CwlO-like protein